VSGFWNERTRNGGLDEVPLPAGPGRLWLCGKHVVGPDPEAVLERTGATTIVCLNEIGELHARYPEYVEWLRVNNGERAMWVPTHDMHPLVDFELVVGAVRQRLDEGGGVVIHCGAGIGRAGTLASAVLVSLGMRLDTALEHVRAHRPMAGPQTREQELALEEYARSQH
jgi:protein-tyrosine phosphatase